MLKRKKNPVILSPWAIVIKILGSSKYHSQFVKWCLFQWNHLNYWKEILNLNLKNNNNKFWVCNIISIFFIKKNPLTLLYSQTERCKLVFVCVFIFFIKFHFPRKWRDAGCAYKGERWPKKNIK